MINVYDSREINFTHNGLVVLNDCKVAFVDEELNGKYELELEYPLDDKGKWQHLIEENIVKADGQLFRIYHKEKTLAGIKINAKHIFYDLMDNFLEDVRPTNLSGSAALDWILSHTQYPHSFINISDLGGQNTRYFIRKNPVEAIMGKDGIIETWGGELARDNFTIKLLQARGQDRGVLISYGKNILGIDETLIMDAVCTRLLPVGKDGLLLDERYIDSPIIGNYPHPIIKTVDFSDCEDQDSLRAAGQEYLSLNDKPQVNYQVDFIELSKTTEYKNYAVLETVYQGDTVTIRHSRLNIDLKAKVIRIKKNELTNRIEEIELGSFRPSYIDGITNPINEVKQKQAQDKSDLQTAMDNATTQINSALGGYVVKRNSELLIMDTEDPMTATKVWRWNQGGLGYSGTGYNGEFRTAITADGHIVADFMDTGNMTANIIKTGTITSKTGKLTINMDDEVLNIGGKIIYDSATDHVTFDPSVVLSWGNIGDKPNIPSTAADVGALPADTPIPSTAADVGALPADTPIPNGDKLDDAGNYVGTVDYTLQVSGKPTILTADDIKTTVITKDWIATLGLLVGTEIQMGTNATISWAKVTDQPSIPTTASDIGAETPLGAQAKADAAQSAATSVANTAQSTANSAASAASNAQSTANSASSAASNAQSTANSAYNLAAAAVTPVGLSTELGQDYVVTGKLTANQIQTGTYNANGAPINANGTVIDSNGVAVTGGKISVTNPAGTVIIDGTSNMLKVLATGTVSHTFAYGNSGITVTIAHNLGYIPASLGYAYYNVWTSYGGWSWKPATALPRDIHNNANLKFPCSITADTSNIYINLGVDIDTGASAWFDTNYPVTINIKYYIFKEVAF